MVVGSRRESSLHVRAELHAEVCQFLDQELVVAIVCDVAEGTVLVERLRVVDFVVRLVVVLVVRAILLRVESRHHADAAQLVLRVHEIHLVTERGEIHSGGSTHAVDEGKDGLVQRVHIVDGLLKVVLCPCGAARRVDVEDVATAHLVVGRTDEPVAQFDGAVRAGTAVARNGAIHGQHIDERRLHRTEFPGILRLAVLRHLVFENIRSGIRCTLYGQERMLLFPERQCRVRVQVVLNHRTRGMDEIGRYHPEFCR